MSQHNVEIVHSIYAAWERGDFRSAEWADGGIECEVADCPTPGGGAGLASMAQAMSDYGSPWEGYRVEVEEYRELDENRVLVLIRQHGRGGASGVELGHMRTKSANVMQLHNGKVTRLIVYWDRERAFSDLGLGE